MNSRADLANKSFFSRGFSLLEMLLVTALLTTLAVLTFPVGLGFFQMQEFFEAHDDLVFALRRAQAQSVFAKNDSQFGVRILSNSFVIFQGHSYAARSASEDETFLFPGILHVSGTGEFVFSKLGGTTTPGEIAISLRTQTRFIRVNEKGIIE